MEFLGERISLNPRPQPRAAATLEVAMLGHCPGQMRLERLKELPEAVAEIRRAGFAGRLEACFAAEVPHLDHLPLPLHSAAEFNDIFPDARTAATRYRSRLAGAEAWLPQAVEDFFASGGDKLWVVPIPESEEARGFFPAPQTVLHDSATLRGVATVLVLPAVGVLACPDLERLQIPAALADIPRMRLSNPEPRFVPMSASSLDDDHRERRLGSELVESGETLSLHEVLRQLLVPVVRHRPDIQCLFTLPLSWSGEQASPALDPVAVDILKDMMLAEGGTSLRHLQLLFPYLRSRRYALRSPVGTVAGLQASSARTRGPWRSVAGIPLLTDGRPFPPVSVMDTVRLRREPGIGVLHYRRGQLRLDDERLVVPALHPGDYRPAYEYQAGEIGAGIPDRYDGYRSAEVMRFLGYLTRQLRALGDSLAFNADFRDPRPRLVLEQFFRRLFQQGALRGRLPEQAYTIRQHPQREGVLGFDIAIAPAFPIDRVVLTFVNRDGSWHAEVSHV